jgi:hypothetical protein
MFKIRYRTTQLTADANAKRMSILEDPTSVISQMRLMNTYSVVKFMVTVRLVEKSVKSQVGTVMVRKVIIQKSMLGVTLRTTKAHELSCPLGMADRRVAVAGSVGDDAGP